MNHMLRCLLPALLSPALAVGQESAAEPAPERIHIIGASVSGGFQDGPLFGAKAQGQSVSLHRVLKQWAGDEVKVTTHPPMEMWNLFRDPEGIGRKQVELATRRKPDVVVAIDFPFWFAYGYVRGDELEARTALLDKGLAYLAELGVPVLLGDLPDMRGAAARMLNPRQVPSEQVLAQLNAKLVAFADARPDVSLVPMASLVRELKDEGVELPLADGKLRTAPGALLQEDRLHANRLGMALLAYRLQDPLRELFPAGHPLREQRWTFERFVAAARADVDLEAMREAAAAKAETGR